MALAGRMDGRVVNLVDESPTTAYEMVSLVGEEMPLSAGPLVHPWRGRADGSLARSLGFRPSVRTVYQTLEEGLL